MTSQATLKELKEEILLLIDYAAPEEQIESASNFLDSMQSDRLALNIMKEFYSYLPEAENDAIMRIQLLESRQNNFLMLVTTNLDMYFYVVNIDRAEFAGRHSEGLWDQDLLDFFNMQREDALKKFQSPENFPEYLPLGQTHSHCLVCSAKEGEYHQFGCPLEICPWCEGQLANCKCRFAKMGTEIIQTEKQIQDLLDLLDKKGRVPFDTSQKLGGLRE